MNTAREEPKNKSLQPYNEDAFGVPDGEGIKDAEGRKKLTDNIARLEIDLDSEKEERKEERFYWICAVAFILDPIIYYLCGSFPPFLLIFMFQLVIMAGIAQKLGVDWAVQSIGGLLHWITERARLK